MWFIRKKEKSISFLFPPVLSFSYDSCNTQNLNRFTSYIASTSSLNYQCPLSKNKNCYSYLEWWVKYYINLHTPPAAGNFIIDITFSPLHIYNFTCLLCRRRKKYRNWLKPFFFSYSHLLFCSLFFRRLKLSFTASFILSNNITTLSKTTLFQHATPASTKMNEKKKRKKPTELNERTKMQTNTTRNINEHTKRYYYSEVKRNERYTSAQLDHVWPRHKFVGSLSVLSNLFGGSHTSHGGRRWPKVFRYLLYSSCQTFPTLILMDKARHESETNRSFFPWSSGVLLRPKVKKC